MKKNNINFLVFPVIISATVLLTIALNDRTLKPIEQKMFDIERILWSFLLVGIIVGCLYGGSIIFK